jgi:hypothetical protein
MVEIYTSTVSPIHVLFCYLFYNFLDLFSQHNEYYIAKIAITITIMNETTDLQAESCKTFCSRYHLFV